MFLVKLTHFIDFSIDCDPSFGFKLGWVDNDELLYDKQLHLGKDIMSLKQAKFEAEPTREIQLKGRNYSLVGTAHVSKKSENFVENEVLSGRYDAIAIELCDNRYKQLTEPQTIEDMDIFQVIKEKKVMTVVAMLAISSFQEKIGNNLNVRPGAEFIAAIEAAKKKNLPVFMIDRDISVTFSRAMGALSFWQKIAIFNDLVAGIFSKDSLTTAQLEDVKNEVAIEEMIAKLASDAPELHLTLLDERDRFMAAKLAQIDAESILVVVGAGHLKGLSDNLSDPVVSPEGTIESLSLRPQKSMFKKCFPFLVLLLILIGFVFGFSKSPNLGFEIVSEWIVINGGLSALGVLIAAGHPLTILTAFFAAPITSLNPTVGAGMVTGLVEAWIRKPRVSDFSKLRKEAASFRGWRKNRVARIFLVFLLGSFGSALGTYVAGFRIFEKLVS